MTGLNVIADLSHHNGTVDLVRAKAAGIQGVIHKATQGTTFQDQAYAGNRANALAAGLLFGAYHFGTGADGARQADFFLKTVQPDGGTLLALDIEENPKGPSMTLDQARAFVSRVQAKTGRWPGLYGGSYLKQQLGTTVDPLLRNCWLWHSQYGPAAKIQKTWKSWTMWQYTDGASGPEPHTVDGIGACDRDTFNGTPAELRALWVMAPVAVGAGGD